MHAVSAVVNEFHNREDEVLRFVEGIEHSFRVTVIVAAPEIRPFTSIKRSFPVPGTRLSISYPNFSVSRSAGSKPRPRSISMTISAHEQPRQPVNG